MFLKCMRVMLWDALSYQEQLRELERSHKGKNDLTYSAEFLSGMKKSDKLKPVCTIVLYFSEQEWDGPKCLHELLELKGIPEQLKPWVADYPMVLVDVYRFEEWEKFQTDLREVFGFIQSSVDKDKMKQFLKKYEKDLGAMSEDACEMIESITGTANIRKFRMRQKELPV